MKRGALGWPRWTANAIMAATLLLALLLSVAQGPKVASAAPFEASLAIAVKDNFYEPKDTTVAAGTAVTWTNLGRQRHTVTGVDRFESSGSGGIKEYAKSGDLNPGQSYSMRLDKPGTYRFMCERHKEQMRGVITVVAAPSGGPGVSPPASPSPSPPASPSPGPSPNPPATPPPAPALPPAPKPAPAPAPGAATVSVGDSFFSSTTINVSTGATVSWTNQGGKPHTVTSDTGLWDSGPLNPGQSYSFSFQNPGTYSYNCVFHGGMVGKVVVSGGAPAPSPAPPAATPPAAPPPPPGGQPPAAPPPAPAAPPPAAPNPAPPARSNGVALGDDLFSPASLSVVAGTTVTWANNGQRPHTVTGDGGLWDSGMLRPGQSFSFTFQNPGTYPYSCAFHSGMNGSITVSGAAAPSPGGPGPSPTNPPAPTVSAPSPTASPTPSRTATPAPAPPGDNGVSLGDDFFSPGSLSVSAGATVTWVNNGRRPHTVTGDGGTWDSGMLRPGQSYSFTFQSPGTYGYSCALHDGMVGTITVSGNGAVPGPTTPTPTATPTPTPVATPAPAPPGDNGVSLGDDFFSPASLSVAAGTTVNWVNNGQRPHTVTSDAGLWDSGMLGAGQSFSFTFQSPGTYSYSCAYHGGMSGTVVVSGAGPSPTPSPIPTATPSPADTPLPVPADEGSAVSMGDDFFSQASLTLPAGTAVNWRNDGRRPHTVTSDDGLWDSGVLMPGQSYSFTFRSAGTHTYSCILHVGMVGTMVVEGAPGAEEPAPALEPAQEEPGPAAVVAAESNSGEDSAPAAGGPKAPPVSEVSVPMLDNSFSPETVSVPVGTAITWTNEGRAPHTSTGMDGLFDSGLLKTGESFSFLFDKVGVYEYFCIFHPDMVGNVSVQAGGTASGQSAAPPNPGSGREDQPSANSIEQGDTAPLADAATRDQVEEAVEQAPNTLADQPLDVAVQPGGDHLDIMAASSMLREDDTPLGGISSLVASLGIPLRGPSPYELLVFMAAAVSMTLFAFNVFLFRGPRRKRFFIFRRPPTQ